MIVFAILHKPSGSFLPAIGHRRGHTHAEINGDKLPRIFRTRAHATAALKWWLGGAWYESERQDDDGDYYYDMEVIKRPERIADEMEVVALILEVVA